MTKQKAAVSLIASNTMIPVMKKKMEIAQMSSACSLLSSNLQQIRCQGVYQNGSRPMMTHTDVSITIDKAHRY